jgi:hypothetical protein
MKSMIQILVDGIIAVDRESTEFDRSTSDLLDQIIEEFGDCRRTVETDNLLK